MKQKNNLNSLNFIDFIFLFILIVLFFITSYYTYFYLNNPNKSQDVARLLPLIALAFFCIIIAKVQAIQSKLKRAKYLKDLIRDNKYILCKTWTDKIVNYAIGTHKNNFISNKCRAYITYKTQDNQEYWFASPTWNAYEYPYQIGGSFKVYVDIEKNPYLYHIEYQPPEEFLNKNNLIIYSKSLKYKTIDSLRRCGISFTCILGFLVSLAIFKENINYAFIFLIPTVFYLVKFLYYEAVKKKLLQSDKAVKTTLIKTNNNQDGLASAIYNYKDSNNINYNFRITHIDASVDINKLLKHDTPNSSDILQNMIIGFPNNLDIYFKKDNPYIFYID